MAPPLPPSSDDVPTPSTVIDTNTIGRVIPRCVVILYYDGDDEAKTADKAFVAKKFGVLAENIVSVKVQLTADPKIVAIFVVFKTTEISNFVLRKAKQLAGDQDIEFVPAENWLVESAKHLASMKVHTAESAYHLFYERNKRKLAAVKPPAYAPLPKPTGNANLFEILNSQRPQTVDVSVNSGNTVASSSTPSSSIFRSAAPTASTSKSFPSVPTDPSAAWGRQPPPLQHQYPQSAGPFNPYSQPTSINSPLGWPPMSAPPYPSFGASGSNPLFPSSQGTSSPLFPANSYAGPRPGNGFFSNADGFSGYPHPFGGAQQFQPPGPRPQQPPSNNFNQFDGSY